jgi:TolB-like protein/DNA-binding winged helix-turn-helix (wHTH) protein/Tfp pilus assembly protein PilF
MRLQPGRFFPLLPWISLAMKTTPSRTAVFGPYELNVRSGELRKFGTRVKMGEQAFQILCMLIENPGEMVTREQLRAKLWAQDTFVDFDHGLNSAMQRLRDCLSDSAGTPRWIATIPRRGYRFVGPVEWLDEDSATPLGKGSLGPAGSGANGKAAINLSPVLPRSAGRGSGVFSSIPRKGYGVRARVLTSAAIVIVGLAVILNLRILQERRLASGSSFPIRSLAVLPLVNLSSDAGRDYFTDGMTEELTTDLAKISALRVISRTSVMKYKGTKKTLPEIARELNVDGVVEGTVARSGNRLRITANLVQASPEQHLWADSYESELGDVLTLQGQVAQAIARKIQITLTQDERVLLGASRPVSPEAHDLYWMGRYTLEAGTADSSKAAIKYFEKAIQKDPNFAEAYAGLAGVYAVWIPGMNRPRDLMPKAKEFAQKALQLDNTLADAHSVMGSVKLFYDWDWSGAEEEFKQTMKFNPNHAAAHRWHSRGLVIRGQREEAIAEARLSLSLDPSPHSWDYPIWVFFLAHRYDLAGERARELLEVAPNYVWGHYEQAQIYEQQGASGKAAQEFSKAEELFGADAKKIARIKEALVKSGPEGFWRQILANYEESAKSEYVPAVLVAQACIRIGNQRCAFEWLERGYEERDDLMVNLTVEPVFGGVREDPRFQNLIRRVGLPQ